MVSTIFAFRKRNRPEFIELEQLSRAEKPGFLRNSLQTASGDLQRYLLDGLNHQ